MKRLAGRYSRWWLPAAGVTLVALLLFILMTPAGSAVAAAKSHENAKIYYDPPLKAGEAGSEYVIGAKWDKNPVTYSFANCPRALPCDQAQEQVREAVEAWDAVCGLTLNEVPSGGDINIGWYRGDHGDGNPFDGPGNVLAHAYFPLPYLGDLAGDVHFDDDEAWVTGQPTAPNQVHLKTTAMHEVGHALGLDHSTDPTALMWAEYTGIKTIGPDDLAGIQSLYGPPNADDGAGSVPASPVAPSAVTATATTNVRVRSGPGTGFAQVGSIDTGATVPVLGKNAAGDWLYVESAGVRGWAATFLFTVQGDLNTVPVVDQNGGGGGVPTAVPTTEPPPAEPTAVPTENPGGAVTGVAISTVRVRSGPGTSYSSVGAVDSGATVEIVARTANNAWVFIHYNGIQGWVATWLLTVTGDVNTLPVLQPVF